MVNQNGSQIPAADPPGTTPLSQATSTNKDSRTYALLSHLVIFPCFIVPFFGNILGPLVIWLIYKDKDAFVEKHARESLNFQVSMTIYALISLVLWFLFNRILGILVIFIIIIMAVFVIKASIAANKGRDYEYKFSLRLVKK